MNKHYLAYVRFSKEHSDKVSESYDNVFDSFEDAEEWLAGIILDYRNDNDLRFYEISDSGIIEIDLGEVSRG